MATTMMAAPATAVALRAVRGRGLAALGTNSRQPVFLRRCIGSTTCAAASTQAGSIHHVSSSSSHQMPMIQQQPFSRAYLSTQPKTAEEPSAEEVAELGERIAKVSGRTPSILKSLPENFTPGLALSVLQTESAGGAFVRLTDFRDLAQSSRAGHKRDARSILTALKDFKRCNSFLVDTRGARVAMEGMLRSMIPLNNEEYGSPTAVDKINASLYVLDAFSDTDTGLYYAAKTEYVEINMNLLLESVKEANLKLPAGFGEESGEDDEDGPEEEVDEDEDGSEHDEASAELARRVLHATRDTMAALIRRGSNPERNMSKRRSRKYLKQIRVDEGPAPSTVHVGVQICLELGASAKLTRDMVLSPYRAAHYKADDGTMKLVVNKKKAEKDTVKAAEEKAAADAAATAAAEAAEEAKEQEAESSNNDEDTSVDEEGRSEVEGDDSGSNNDTDAKREQ